MSSTRYSAVLTADARLRALVAVSGKSLTILGLLILWTMELSDVLRSLAAIGWAAANIAELRRLKVVYGRYSRVRIDSDGGLEVFARDDDWRPARLRNGCLVLSRFAWLRISLWDGCRSSELLAGISSENEQWRRFQVIWRHMGGPR